MLPTFIYGSHADPRSPSAVKVIVVFCHRSVRERSVSSSDKPRHNNATVHRLGKCTAKAAVKNGYECMHAIVRLWGNNTGWY